MGEFFWFFGPEADPVNWSAHSRSFLRWWSCKKKKTNKKTFRDGMNDSRQVRAAVPYLWKLRSEPNMASAVFWAYCCVQWSKLRWSLNTSTLLQRTKQMYILIETGELRHVIKILHITNTVQMTPTWCFLDFGSRQGTLELGIKPFFGRPTTISLCL